MNNSISREDEKDPLPPPPPYPFSGEKVCVHSLHKGEEGI